MPLAQQNNEAQWPPRSPHDVLRSTPGGRERLRRMMNRTSPSPSPLRNPRPKSALDSRSLNPDAASLEHVAGDDDEEEDEETLQLKLQEIQARLRLKKLQNAKSKKPTTDGEEDYKERPGSAPLTKQRQHLGRYSALEKERQRRPQSQNAVEVPVSPVRSVQAPLPQTSPSRVLLGIDKGLKARDVSLKRAPSLRRPHDPQGATSTGGYLKRSRTPNPALPRDRSHPDGGARPMSFNERLASARSEETERTERQKRIERIRKTGFGVDQGEMERYKTNAVEIPDEPLQPPEFSRDQVLASQSNKCSAGLRRSNTVPSIRSQRMTSSKPTSSNVADGLTDECPGKPDSESASFEPYSSFHLSKRILPHQVLARHIKGMKVFSLKDLLRQVKSPDYSLPDIEQDIVIFAIVAKKSDPREHKPPEGASEKKAPDRTKYMVLSLVDLEYEVELFLFDSGFTRFWKLTEGILVGILNPVIMPPPKGRIDTGKFSLVINSDADTILEVGTARDLGFCKSVKKDGNSCSSWVNKKRTEFCEFHTNEAVRKQRATRLELNNTGLGGGSKWKSKSKRADQSTAHQSYDRETHSHWFASKSLSTADRIDGVNRAAGGAAERKEKEEALKRKLLSREREQTLMKTLGQVGASAGRDYMRQAEIKSRNHLSSSVSSATLASNSSQVTDNHAQLGAVRLELMAASNVGTPIHLSPIKRKRPDSSQCSTSSSVSKAALGWGGGLKDKLSRMKEGEKLVKDQAPVRKKTRFVTEKGIREAGRESLGTELSAHPQREVLLDDDDEDELVIVK